MASTFFLGEQVLGVTTGHSTEPPVVSQPGTLGAAAAIDGTPIRVVSIALAAAVGLWALRAAGFRFNVGVSS